MSKIVYAYWEPRGLGEACRCLLRYVNVEFEDKRYKIGTAPEYDKSEWIREKYNLGLDFPNLPYLIDGNIKITQSIAILRYLARKYKLTGENEDDTIRIELAEQQSNDLRFNLSKICYSPHYEKLREEYVKALPEKLEQVSKFLGDYKFVIGDRLSYADFLLYEALDFHRIFEGSSLDAYENLKAYLERFEALPAIEKYMKSGKFSKLPIFGPMAFFGGESE